MNSSEQIDKIAEALAKAQGAFTNPPRTREVMVTMRAGGTFTFCYATLDGVMEMIRKPLADNGLSVVQSLGTDEQGPICETRLIHSSGQWMTTWIPVIVDENANAQGWGSAITYARRYGVCTLLAIAADEDDDANAASGHEATKADRSPRKKGKPSSLSAQRSAAWDAVRAACDNKTTTWLAFSTLCSRIEASEFPVESQNELMVALNDAMHYKLITEASSYDSEEKLNKAQRMVEKIWPDRLKPEALETLTIRRAALPVGGAA
jgi:hypothetical protein